MLSLIYFIFVSCVTVGSHVYISCMFFSSVCLGGQCAGGLSKINTDFQ